MYVSHSAKQGRSALTRNRRATTDGLYAPLSLRLRLVLALIILSAASSDAARGFLPICIPDGSLTSFVQPDTAYADVRQDDIVGGLPLSLRSVDDAPSVIAPSALIATEDGTILWERGGYRQVPIASTTKIMTAVLALENCPLDKECLVTRGAASTDGTSAWLREGDRLTLYNLLIGLLLPSGNDAAVAIAENVAGTQFAFVEMMNAKAQALGMFQTHFIDPHGLGEDGLYSTVRDYLILARYAMRFEAFRQIVGMSEATTYTLDGIENKYETTNKLFYFFRSEDSVKVLGIKTGTNYEADACLVACLSYHGVVYYTVVFGAPLDYDRYTDTAAMFNWAISHYQTIELINSSVLVADMALISWQDKTVQVYAPYPIFIEVFNLNGPITQEVELGEWRGSVTRGQKVGRIIWSQGTEVLATSDLVAADSVDEPSFWERVSIGWERLTSGFGGRRQGSKTVIYLSNVFDIPF